MITFDDCNQILKHLNPSHDVELKYCGDHENYLFGANPALKKIYISPTTLSVGHTYDEIEWSMAHELGHIKLNHAVDALQPHIAEFEADWYAHTVCRISPYAQVIAILRAHSCQSLDCPWLLCSDSHPSLLARAVRLGLNDNIFADTIDTLRLK